MTGQVELVTKVAEGEEFVGVRFWLYLPVTQYYRDPDGTMKTTQVQAPFLHRPGDDDSSAVTFWGKTQLRATLETALKLLDQHHEEGAPE
jgi:hypothetical protein